MLNSLPGASAPDVDEWLRAYTPGSALFASPTVSLMTHGVALRATPDNREGRLEDQVRALLRQATEQGLREPLVLGAIPFNPTQPGTMLVPLRHTRHPALRRPPQPPAYRVSANTVARHECRSPGERYENEVRRALAAMRDSPIRKLVMARTLAIALNEPLDRQAVLHNLLHHNAAGYTYALPLADQPHDPPTFLGATPELLVRRDGARVVVNPLAGTAARHRDPGLDRARADQLLASAKDRHEHAIVIDDVVQILSRYCRNLVVPDGPALTATANLWHLSTTISGELADPATSSLTLALAMHPTPAVCGFPTDLAMRTIEAIEPFDRGYFAGAIGWCDAHGNGEWAVSLRCAHYDDQTLTLSAGAGIVPGSKPHLERQETGNKLMTMLNALGLSQRIDTD